MFGRLRCKRVANKFTIYIGPNGPVRKRKSKASSYSLPMLSEPVPYESENATPCPTCFDRCTSIPSVSNRTHRKVGSFGRHASWLYFRFLFGRRRGGGTCRRGGDNPGWGHLILRYEKFVSPGRRPEFRGLTVDSLNSYESTSMPRHPGDSVGDSINTKSAC